MSQPYFDPAQAAMMGYQVGQAAGQFGAPVQQQYQQPMPVQPGYPAQQYNFPVPPAAQPQVPLAQGTLDDFFDQPTVGGGPGLPFKLVGTEHYVEVTRPITKADVQQQTDTRNVPQFFKDGRPKFQMLVPVQVLNSNIPEAVGKASVFYLKGATREKLAAAMAAAGAPAGPPEAGSRMRLRYSADIPTGAGYNPRKDIDIVYERPTGAPAAEVPQLAPTPAPAPQQAAPAPLQGLPAQPAPINVPPAGQLGQPLPQPLPMQQMQPGQSYVAQPPAGVGPQPTPAPAPSGMPAMPDGLTEDQKAGYAAILAQLGQQQG